MIAPAMNNNAIPHAAIGCAAASPVMPWMAETMWLIKLNFEIKMIRPAMISNRIMISSAFIGSSIC